MFAILAAPEDQVVSPPPGEPESNLKKKSDMKKKEKEVEAPPEVVRVASAPMTEVIEQV